MNKIKLGKVVVLGVVTLVSSVMVAKKVSKKCKEVTEDVNVDDVAATENEDVVSDDVKETDTVSKADHVAKTVKKENKLDPDIDVALAGLYDLLNVMNKESGYNYDVIEPYTSTYIDLANRAVSMDQHNNLDEKENILRDILNATNEIITRTDSLHNEDATGINTKKEEVHNDK